MSKPFTLLSTIGLALFCQICPLKSPCAQLEFILSPDTYVTTAGDTVTFSGSLTNKGTSELFLNGTNVTLFGTGLSVDDNLFFINTPLSLSSAGEMGDTFTGELFTVTIGANAQAGNYFGLFGITGGDNAFSLEEISSQTFQVQLRPVDSSVPEARGGLISGIFVILLGGLYLQGRSKRCSNNPSI